ncbi:MAG: RNA methyltransferase [Prevotella sp.]|nr:RNA methyltransferase [Prevotella sp.]
MEITSAQNPRIKHLLLLQQKSQERRREGLFVVEGVRELQHCIEGGYEVESLFVCEELMGDDLRKLTDDIFVRSLRTNSPKPSDEQSEAFGQNLLTIPPQLYERVAYRGSTEGVIAIVKERKMTLDSLNTHHSTLNSHHSTLNSQHSTLNSHHSPLIMVLEGVEKPGNLGAVLRSADAAKADAVIVCDPLTDLYNPNLIRASIGAVFTVPTVACSSEECIAFLKEHGIRILTAQLQDSHLYYDTDMRQPTALVMGTESTGLTQQWREAADAHIRIPMLGRLDSLNVSVSAAILLFEAVRQRSELPI